MNHTYEELKKIRYIPANALCQIIKQDIEDLYTDTKNQNYSQAERIIKFKMLLKKVEELSRRVK
jgi:hypothetical protein